MQRLPARIVAEVFNLVTIGDGLVGGSATIRYGLINQGVQEFKVKLPAHWKNVEFTGANIRRRDSTNEVWTIALQDKAWGGYTLVITYDYQFDPKKATNDLSGAHALNVERETGSVAVNGHVRSDPRMPFGGVKESGYGRELSEWGLREFVNVKAVVVH